MAITISPYNHTTKQLLDLGITAQAGNFYAELLDSNASFTASNTTKTQVDNAGAYEVYGNGWTQGGENLASLAVTTVNTDEVKIDATDISVTASGGAIGTATAALLYVDVGASGTTLTPLWYVDFGESKSAADGTAFSLVWNSSGIANVAPV